MEITKIYPPCWFANMDNPKVQLVIQGNDLANARVIIGDKLELEHKIIIHSNNYIVLNVDTSDVKSNTSYKLQLKRNGEVEAQEYKFLPRRNKRIEALSMKDAIYLLMPDRFAITDNKHCLEKNVIDKNKPDCWHGGTLKGITAHVGDIADMGFTAIWHTPVFENKQKVTKDAKYYNYHGYAITDFYKIDPHFGNIDNYCEFVDTAHKKGLKVIMDMVFNHCCIDHPFVKNPPVKDWFNDLGEGERKLTNYSPLSAYDKYASGYDIEHFVRGWFTQNMPDINLSNDIVLDYMTQMSIWWIETTDIDAFRIDTYPYAGVEYMQKWQKRLYAEYPQFPILSEAWVGETEYVAKMQSDNLATIPESTMTFMDFAFQRRLSDTPIENKAREIYTHFALDFAYKNPCNLLAFIDNHDVARWLHKHPSVEELKQAIGLLLTIPRIPQVYYGTEILLAGDGTGDSDGNMRQDYPWDISLTAKQQDFKTYISKLLEWRKGCKAITEGEVMHFVPLDGKVYVYFRYIKDDKGNVDKDKVVMVVINFSGEEMKLPLSRFKEILSVCELWNDVIEDKEILLNYMNSITIKANGIIILDSNKNDCFFVSCEKCCCGCSHNQNLYIVLASTLCICVLLILLYFFLSQCMQNKHERWLLDSCKKKEQ